MKKTLRTLMMGMMALLAGNTLTSCSNDEEPQVAQQEGQKGYVEFTLTRGADTRTAYEATSEGGLDVTWSEGDKMVVFYEAQTANEIIEVFDLVEGAGEKTAKFAKSDSKLADKSGIIGIGYRPNYDANKPISEYLFDFSTQEGTIEDLGKYDLFSFDASLEEGKIKPLGKKFFYPTMVFLHFPTNIDFGTGITTSDFVFSGGVNKHASYSDGIEGDITVKDVNLTNGKLNQDLYVAVYNTTPTSFSVGGKTFSLPGGFKAGNIYTFAQENLKEVDITPLTLEPVSEDVTVTIRNELGLVISYVLDGGEKVSNTEGDRNNITFTVPAGSKVQLFGDNEAYATREYSYWTNIQCSADCYIYGNIMSLIDSENYITKTELTGVETFARLFDNNTRIKNHPNKALTLPATTLTNNCYARMFYGCTGLTTAPKLPATDLAIGCYKSMFYGCSFTTAPELLALNLADACYQAMFSHCTSLTTAPELPATTLTNSCYFEMFRECTSLITAPELPSKTMVQGCYNSMFQDCNSLTKAPELPATDLAVACYELMFQDCISLTTAPELPATTLEERCYRSMFEGCTSLKAMTCLAINISASRCTYNWMKNVASGGTFTRAATMDEGQSWGDGVSGIPSGWSVVNYGG
ncbi:MAG: hypothetical protein ILA03_07085 [Bacteroidaceae bacterium]|nr:hypothetical protein [Bacteroidaceae bacterium]